ncbi:MAG: tripartite tricarboxylate transporter substrate-binding protein [Candidatus Binatota bacterium]
MGTIFWRNTLAISAWLSLALWVSPTLAQEFYKGKTIRLIVATTPGGGFDAYSRAIARHMNKHISGNPTIIVENMPGAGMLIGTNYVYKQAKPDGLTVGNWIGTLVLGQITSRKGVEFDARKFEYVGAPVRNHDLCLMTKASGITSAEKWMASKTPVKMGATPPGSTPFDVAAILKEATDLPAQLVSGYKGTADIRVAVDSGEVAGLCGLSWASARVTWRKQLETGDVVVVLQSAPKAHPDLPNVPLSINLAKTEMGRKLIQAGIHDTSVITYLYSLPPGTPKERVQILRRAFEGTMKDSDFLAETTKANMEINSVTGEDLEKIVNDFFKLDAAVVNKLKEILK